MTQLLDYKSGGYNYSLQLLCMSGNPSPLYRNMDVYVILGSKIHDL